MVSLPLFPLHTVLFPGGLLPLRIFEARYLDMVSQCLRSDSVFGVCLIRSGSEVGVAADCHDIGTSARVADWSATAEGLLAICVRGERIFRIHSRQVGDNKLLHGRIEWLAEPAVEPVPEEFTSLRELLCKLAGQLSLDSQDLINRVDESDWLSFRLGELLPMDLECRQTLLEANSARDRLGRIQHMLAGARSEKVWP